MTVHHDEFRNLGQRVPRVRFGQVDVYDATSATDLTEVPTWSPLVRRTVHPTVAVPRVVPALAGPENLGRTPLR